MALTEVTAKKNVGGVDKAVSTTFDFGNDLKEMVAKFGEQVVFTNARGAFVISLQAIMRRYLETGKTDEEIKQIVANWKPGIALARQVDPVAALVGAWDTFSDEKKAEILRKLKGAK